ncbi:chymotrypsinogen A-like [Trichogramma pretiosum]|uniref:chymotrypsinogen A-like n=1 Tax=Trichogramma pretiosum TaxID=7493 RepID=UPI000C719596|nr:chymotrypsinogen A-like [Trichogramma pretiosum]
MLQVNFFVLCTLCLVKFRLFVIGVPLNDGKKAEIGEFKYQVALLEEDDYIANCGGGIIDAKFILTAAHCVIDPIENEFKSTGLFVMAGAVDLYDNSEVTEKVRVIKIWVPDEYPDKNADPEEPYLSTGDIAVLELVHPLTLNKVSSNLPELNKLDLPTADSDYADKTAVITGYGLYNVDWTSMKFDEHDQVIHIGDDTSSNKLHHAEARVISNEACKSTYHPSIKSRHLCANVLHCPRGQCSKPGICQVCNNDSKKKHRT